MIKFRQYIDETRRMSREKDWNPYTMAKAPGQKGDDNKSVLDYKIAQHKIKQRERDYQAGHANELADKKREKFGESPVTRDLDSKAHKARHMAKRERQAVEAGERVKSGTERKLTKRAPASSTPERKTPERKKGVLSRLFGR